MINIIREMIPRNTRHLDYEEINCYSTDCAIINRHSEKMEPYHQLKQITKDPYAQGVIGCLKKVQDTFDQELNWLIIKSLSEVPSTARIIQEIIAEDFSTNNLASILLDNFERRTNELSIVCSPVTLHILGKVIRQDKSVCGSFYIGNTFMSIPITVEPIPENEIWIIDLNSWRLPITEPEDLVEFDRKRELYIYTRDFRMSSPYCVGDKLIRIKLIAENVETRENRIRLAVKEIEEKEMRELLDRMRLPLREEPAKKSTPIGFLVPMGESVWLTENPEYGLCVTNIPPKDNRYKTLPQMFNPVTIEDYRNMQIKNSRKKK